MLKRETPFLSQFFSTRETYPRPSRPPSKRHRMRGKEKERDKALRKAKAKMELRLVALRWDKKLRFHKEGFYFINERWRGKGGNERLRATHDYPLIAITVDRLRAGSVFTEVFVFVRVSLPFLNFVAHQSPRSFLGTCFYLWEVHFLFLFLCMLATSFAFLVAVIKISMTSKNDKIL